MNKLYKFIYQDVTAFELKLGTSGYELEVFADSEAEAEDLLCCRPLSIISLISKKIAEPYADLHLTFTKNILDRFECIGDVFGIAEDCFIEELMPFFVLIKDIDGIAYKINDISDLLIEQIEDNYAIGEYQEIPDLDWFKLNLNRYLGL